MRFQYHIFISIPIVAALLLASCSKDDSNPANSDTQKPSVSFVQPSTGYLTKDSVLTVELSASDNVGVQRIEIFFDGAATPAATLTASPWLAHPSIATLSTGAHTVSARAYDAAGNSAEAGPVPFKVLGADALMIRFKAGSVFVYDRWDLDENSVKVPGTQGVYTSRILSNGGVTLAGYNDWIYNISTDSRLTKIDTLRGRTDATGDLMLYGFVRESLRRFMEGVSGGSSGTLPDPSWDIIGKFNDANGNPLPLGTQWDIGPSGGASISVDFNGFPLNITIKFKGSLVSRSDVVTVGGKGIRTWKVKITASFSILGNSNQIVINAWFSDDPNGQIKLLQEGTTVTVLTQSFPVPGDIQELVSYQ